MAQDDRINLISEFTEQKKNKFIILTTFNFDPFFFDSYLFPTLRDNNRLAEIVVLIDYGQYQLAYPSFTNITGVEYHLIPIRLASGFFHPKLFLFSSENSITSYFGSCNLTLQGFTNNAEIVTKNSQSLEQGLSYTSRGSMEILHQLASLNIIGDENTEKIIQQLIGELDKYQKITNNDVEILHNIRKPIMDQVFYIVKENEFEELFVLAPFVSEDAQLIQAILNRFTIKKFVLALQKSNHNVNNLDRFRQVCDSHNTIFSIQEATFKEVEEDDEIRIPRRFHAKIVSLKGSKSYLLTGSPNFTSAALLNTIQTGNCECGVFWKNPDLSILEQIQTIPPRKLSELLSSSKPLSFPQLKFPIDIRSVTFDSITKELMIKTNPTDLTYTLKFRVKEDPFHTTEEKYNFSEGIVKKLFENTTPYEIEIAFDDQIIKRRIFGDIDPVRRMIRGGFSMRRITENLGEILTLDRSAIFAILGVISSMSSAKFGVVQREKTGTKSEEREYFAAREKHPANFDRFLNHISDIFIPVEIEEKSSKKLEDFGSDEDIDEIEIEDAEVTSPSYSKNKLKDIAKFVKKVHSVLRVYYEKTESENVVDGIITFIATFLQFDPYLRKTSMIGFQDDYYGKEDWMEGKRNLFELFEAKLNDLFDGISILDIIHAHHDNLVLHLVCLELATEISVENENLIKCLIKFDFLDKGNYFSLIDKTRMYFLKTKLMEFNNDLFDKSYFSYAYNVLQYEIHKNLERLCALMEKENDDKFLNGLKFLLLKIENSYSKDLFRYIKYDKNTKGGKMIYEVIGDYVEFDTRMGSLWYRGD
jgi:hypothetical protein